MLPGKGGGDDRLPQQEPVVGATLGEAARAYPLEQVTAQPEARSVAFHPETRFLRVRGNNLMLRRHPPDRTDPLFSRHT